jgi:hypothetical protein
MGLAISTTALQFVLPLYLDQVLLFALKLSLEMFVTCSSVINEIIFRILYCATYLNVSNSNPTAYIPPCQQPFPEYCS